MQTVYIVTSGHYSAYGINAVFSTEALAEAYCDLHNRRTNSVYEYTVEPWELDAESDRQLVESGKIYWTRYFTPDSDGWSDGSFAPSDPNIEEYVDKYGRQIVKVSGVIAPDEKSAIKIAAERRAQYLAEKEGIA